MFSPETEKLIKHMVEFRKQSEVDENVYVMEECSELIQSLTKEMRNKHANTIEEACDVLTTIMILLYSRGATFKEIEEIVQFKCNRAIRQYERGNN